MVLIVSILAVLVGTLSVWVIASAARPVRKSTLFTAWSWALTFSLLGVGMAALDSVFALVSREWGEILWYLTAIFGLCPAVAVLGARRPVDRVWNLFVILPLLAVLGWPAMTVLNGLAPGVLQLQAPPLVAYGLVLVMGYGNYIGTRYTWCIVLVAGGLMLLLAPLAGDVFSGLTSYSIRPIGLILVSAGVLLAHRLTVRRVESPGGLDHLWRDFCDFFGVVWARRIMERFQQQARQQQLAVQLAPDGFVWEGNADDQQHELAEAERIMRWLLRRFVDEEWIDARMKPTGCH